MGHVNYSIANPAEHIRMSILELCESVAYSLDDSNYCSGWRRWHYQRLGHFKLLNYIKILMTNYIRIYFLNSESYSDRLEFGFAAV